MAKRIGLKMAYAAYRKMFFSVFRNRLSPCCQYFNNNTYLVAFIIPKLCFC